MPMELHQAKEEMRYPPKLSGGTLLLQFFLLILLALFLIHVVID